MLDGVKHAMHACGFEISKINSPRNNGASVHFDINVSLFLVKTDLPMSSFSRRCAPHHSLTRAAQTRCSDLFPSFRGM